jgi:hypothetical protein
LKCFLEAEAIYTLPEALLALKIKAITFMTAEKYGVKIGVFAKFMEALESCQKPQTILDKISFRVMARRANTIKCCSGSLLERLAYPFIKLFDMLTGRWYWKSISENMAYDPELMFDRLIVEWQTMSLISTLGLTFGVYLSTPL